MATYLPQNKFMDSGTPRSPAVPDTAGVSPCPPDAPAGTIAEPPSNEGRPEEAPAGSAPPNTAAPAGALDVIDCIHEIFHYARKILQSNPRFVLDEAAFMAAIDETPLFVREADGYLRRNA